MVLKKCRNCFQLEEADIRLLLHAAQAAPEGHKAVSSSQMKFCVGRFSPHIGAPLYLRCGTRIHTRFVSIQIDVVNSDCCKSMIGLHTFTGCDSLSAFAGCDHLSTLKITRRDKRDMFAELGSCWEIEGDLIAKLEAFTCELYCPKSGTTERNELRYRLSPDVPYTVGHGLYKKRSSDNEDELQIDWMHGLPAPYAILNLMSCNNVSA